MLLLVLSDDCKNVIIATQPEKDCGTSLTNTWCQEFIEVLSDLPPIEAAGEGTTLRWFEHYDRADPILDEGVHYRKWKGQLEVYAQDKDVAQAWEQLTGEAIPDFAASGFEDEMIEAVREHRRGRLL
jgi:hypothetical protein